MNNRAMSNTAIRTSRKRMKTTAIRTRKSNTAISKRITTMNRMKTTAIRTSVKRMKTTITSRKSNTAMRQIVLQVEEGRS